MPRIYKVVLETQVQFESANRVEALREAKRLARKGNTVVWEMWEGAERVSWKSVSSVHDSIFINL